MKLKEIYRHRQFVRAVSHMFLLTVLLLFIPYISEADNENSETESVIDELSLTVIVQKLGTYEVPAVISGKTAYLSISALFNYLKVKTDISPDFLQINGFLLNPKDIYQVDKARNVITYQGKETQLANRDLILTRSDLYLNTKYFGEIFGLECTFFFRSLSISLNAKVDLPVFKEMRLEERRRFVRQMKGEVVADTIIEKRNPLLSVGTVDWALYNTTSDNGDQYNRANIAAGGYVAGGETNIGINYYSDQPFTEKGQYYRWRYVDNDNKALRQVTAGKIASQSISSIFSPVVGIQLTNTPTTYRKYYGSYVLTDQTEPGWTVELYVNNTLVDFVKADASGFFTFEVPLAYGNTEVRLRFYGPWGEEKSTVQNILIPYTFLPKNEMEYSVNAGIVEDSLNSLFVRSSVNYGVSRSFSVGGGTEYLSSIKEGKNIPFLNASVNLFKKVLLTGEYAYNVRTKGLLTYRLPGNMMLELSYTKYIDNQRAVLFTFDEESKGSITLPLRIKNFSLFTRIGIDQMTYGTTRIALSDLVMSAGYKKFSLNLHTYGTFYNSSSTNVYSDFSISYRLPKGFNFTPLVRYDHKLNEFSGVRLLAEKRLSSRGYINMTYEKYTQGDIENFQVGIRYDFNPAQVSVYGNHTDNTSNTFVSASGSLVFDPATSYIKASNSNKVGRGGLTLVPFLDINCNGKRDKGETRVAGLKVRLLKGGIAIESKKDTLVRVFDLEAYSNASFECSGDGFENISWQVRKRVYSVSIEPNLMKLVEIPVCVLGEISGMVRIQNNEGAKISERFRINIYRDDSILIKTLTAEEDGYYNYLGLRPGKYTIKPDTSQLHHVDMINLPPSRTIIVTPSRDGQVFDNLDFDIIFNKTGSNLPLEGDESYIPEEENDYLPFAIQIGAFKKYQNAVNLSNVAKKNLCKKVEIVQSKNLYHVLVVGDCFQGAISSVLKSIQSQGFPGAFLTKTSWDQKICGL